MTLRRFRRRAGNPGDDVGRPRIDDVVRGRSPMRRVELRVMRDEVRWHRAEDLLRVHGLELVDLDPPGAGPEAALVFAGRSEQDARGDVERLGVAVLASRELRPLLDHSDAR